MTAEQKAALANKGVKWGQWLNAVQKRAESSPWERALIKRMGKG